MAKRRPTTPQERECFFAWMDGYCSMFDELPDGAWQAACEDAVSKFNEKYGTRYDSYDAWLTWCERPAGESPISGGSDS